MAINLIRCQQGCSPSVALRCSGTGAELAKGFTLTKF